MKIEVTARPNLFLDETWDGGSRTQYHICLLDNPSVTVAVQRNGWPNPPSSYTLKRGEVAIVTSVFRGKDMSPRIQMTPEDYDRQILCCQVHQSVSN